MIKQRLIRFKEGDELSESVNELLDYDIDNKKMNERLIEDIQFAELFRKNYGYCSLTEILVKMSGTNTNAVITSTTEIKEELNEQTKKNTIIDINQALDMLNKL